MYCLVVLTAFIICHTVVLQYMGTEEDTRKALIASGMHNSKSLHVDKFEYKTTDYIDAVEDSVGMCWATQPGSSAEKTFCIRNLCNSCGYLLCAQSLIARVVDEYIVSRWHLHYHLWRSNPAVVTLR